MQTTDEFASNSTANIKLSKRSSFLLLTSNKFMTKSKNVATKKKCDGVVALKIPRKLTCDSQFCNVVGCKTQISIELGCSPKRFTWKVERKQCCKSQLTKVTNKGKPPCMFSLVCNLMISRKNYLAKRPCGCNQIRSNQRAGSANTLKHFHMEKL